jgi:AraC-like DNA-binding protein
VTVVTARRKSLLDSPTVQVGAVVYRPTSDAAGEVERQDLNAVVLPYRGVFAKHEAPGRHVVGTPSHAVFIAADTPYRVSFPGAIGDRALTLKFDAALAPDALADAAPQGLLSAQAMMLRTRLGARLMHGGGDPFAQEDAALRLLALALGALRPGDATGPAAARSATRARRARALERVKEAVALAPADKWSVARLAQIAHLSPFHLCHVFRRMTGTSIYDYVLQERLAHALDAVLDGADLTQVALDTGFTSHSHFTARFRGFFGCTPAAFRRQAAAGPVAGQMRKIVTARRSAPVLV